MHALVLLAAAFSAGNADSAVDFDSEIVPILTRGGCNAGACHGAAVGRGGFQLSLYGSDPEFDYQSMVLELEGRRVNHAQPDASLVLLKATESINHEGGNRFDVESPSANLLLQWIRAGTPRLQKRRLERFVVSPTTQVVDTLEATVPLTATAHFSDGSQVDATPWTVFTAEDPSAVAIDSEAATAKLLRRGRQIVIARYLDRVIPIELVVPLSDAIADHSEAPCENFIDRQIVDFLSTLRLPVSPQVDDATYLRRVTLDLTGRLPTIERVRQFESQPTSRAQLVDELLAADEFSEYWTFQLAKLLRIHSQPNDAAGAIAYQQWLNEQVVDAAPYDQMVRQLVTALGNTHEVGPANFYRTVNGPREQAEFVSELFLGSRLRCANCHDHPLDRWTQDDFHGLAAIFAGVDQGVLVTLSGRGDVTHPRTGEPAVPRIPGDRFLDGDSDEREALANWLTDANNPYFAKAIVNRLWKSMLGRGLVEPTDDFRDTNPATHPVLLDLLAADFVQHDYDLRHTLRQIALSATYARSAAATSQNAADDRYYSHALTRPLEPEVLADAISDVLGTPDQYGDEPEGTRAVSLLDSTITSEALDVLGRCSREVSCEASSESAGGLSRKLHLFNGPLINRRLADPDGRLAGLTAAGATASAIVDEFYLRAFCRHPSAEEHVFWEEQFAVAGDDPQNVLEDFVWSLLSCREFTTNH